MHLILRNKANKCEQNQVPWSIHCHLLGVMKTLYNSTVISVKTNSDFHSVVACKRIGILNNVVNRVQSFDVSYTVHIFTITIYQQQMHIIQGATHIEVHVSLCSVQNTKRAGFLPATGQYCVALLSTTLWMYTNLYFTVLIFQISRYWLYTSELNVLGWYSLALLMPWGWRLRAETCRGFVRLM